MPSTPPTAKYLLLFEIWISFVSSTECLVNLICLAFLVHKVLPVAVSITPKGHLVFLSHFDVTKAAYLPSGDKSAFQPCQDKLCFQIRSVSYTHLTLPTKRIV